MAREHSDSRLMNEQRATSREYESVVIEWGGGGGGCVPFAPPPPGSAKGQVTIQVRSARLRATCICELKIVSYSIPCSVPSGCGRNEV